MSVKIKNKNKKTSYFLLVSVTPIKHSEPASFTACDQKYSLRPNSLVMAMVKRVHGGLWEGGHVSILLCTQEDLCPCTCSCSSVSVLPPNQQNLRKEKNCHKFKIGLMLLLENNTQRARCHLYNHV